jgi:two-component system nitrate/nitrite response regulator NarL
MLTERESEVEALVRQGLSNKAVARHLGIAEGTIKIHLHNIYRKLKIKNRHQLVLYALKVHCTTGNVIGFPKTARSKE